jgi:hypothetical protein
MAAAERPPNGWKYDENGCCGGYFDTIEEESTCCALLKVLCCCFNCYGKVSLLAIACHECCMAAHLLLWLLVLCSIGIIRAKAMTGAIPQRVRAVGIVPLKLFRMIIQRQTFPDQLGSRSVLLKLGRSSSSRCSVHSTAADVVPG